MRSSHNKRLSSHSNTSDIQSNPQNISPPVSKPALQRAQETISSFSQQSASSSATTHSSPKLNNPPNQITHRDSYGYKEFFLFIITIVCVFIIGYGIYTAISAIIYRNAQIKQTKTGGDVFRAYNYIMQDASTNALPTSSTSVAGEKTITEEKTAIPEPTMEATPEKYFKYTTLNKQVTINAYTGKDKDVVIPSYIDGNPVTMIGYSAFGNGAADHVESVVLPETIIRIDDFAFHACYNLRNVVLPEGLVYVGEDAFGFCPIETITIPGSIQQMGNGVFWRNGVLKRITIQNDQIVYQGNPFAGCDSLTLNGIILPKNSSQTIKRNNALYSGTTLLYVPKDRNVTSYSISEETEKIADGAFEGLTGLKELWIPDSVKSIGKNAFLSCDSLETIHFGKGLKAIQFCAFIYCGSLKEVELPDGLLSIGPSAFNYCTKLSKITIPSSVRTIEQGAFDKTNNITIYGEKGSAAEEYALNNNHKFVATGKKNDGERKNSIQATSAQTATTKPHNTASHTPSPTRKVKIGSKIRFGHYEQDGNLKNGTEEIEWIVLDINTKEHKALLISKYGLDAQPYNANSGTITWGNCSLRKWLNGAFMNKAFSTAEQKAILLTTVDNGKTQGYSGWNTSSGKNTQDKIFLLSYAEAIEYYSVREKDYNNMAPRVSPTENAWQQGAYKDPTDRTADGEGAGWWCLRSPGNRSGYVAAVGTSGSLFSDRVENSTGCVRPALWVDLDAGIF